MARRTAKSSSEFASKRMSYGCSTICSHPVWSIDVPLFCWPLESTKTEGGSQVKMVVGWRAQASIQVRIQIRLVSNWDLSRIGQNEQERRRKRGPGCSNTGGSRWYQAQTGE